MAVKIEIDGFIKRVKSKGSVFKNKDLLQVFPDGFQFIDMGVFIVVANDKAVVSNINKVASLFLRYAVYGEILMLSGKELPDSLFITAENSKFSPKESDDGIINLLQETLITFKAITEEDDNMIGRQDNFQHSIFSESKKQLLIIDPNKLKGNIEISETDEEDEFIDQFYKSAFKKLSKRSEDLNKIILFEEQTYIIKFPTGKVIETLQVMLDHYIETEDYEKSAVIRDVIKENENIDVVEIEEPDIFTNESDESKS